MEAIEFRTDPEGKVYYKVLGKEEKRLNRFSSEVIDPLLSIIHNRFPECFSVLASLYNMHGASENQKALMVVERFIRCNFGEHDMLTIDVEHDILNFEEVKCPLRGGYCPHENVICKPQGLCRLSPAETDIAKLYVNGMTYDTIAKTLGKNKSTVKVQLLRIRSKLKVKNCREIIRVLRINNIF